MGFTLSFRSLDDLNTTYALTVQAEKTPTRLADFAGGNAKISPEHGYETVIGVRANSVRDDRIELYYLNAKNEEVVHGTIQETEGQKIKPGEGLKIAIEPALTWSNGEILYCSWL